MPYSYGFNANLSQRSLSAWPLDAAPAKTFLLFESCRGVKNATDGGESYGSTATRPRYHILFKLKPGVQGAGKGPHWGGNFAYADGHVKWVRDDHVPPPNTGAWAVGVPAKEKK
jgi:prepilin-type processing-associated H-X9-DG protein